MIAAPQLGRQMMIFPINLLFLSAAKLHQENGCFLPFIGLHAKMQPTERRRISLIAPKWILKNLLNSFF